ncbi:MAG: hypothetical protein JJE28_10540, partial [Actinomycetales bacterium]|nr:hypothetical protein [Actinomycetales bacterium]
SENAVRNRRLNHLVTDVELPVAPDDLERNAFDLEAVREVFGRLEFRSLLERVIKLGGGAPTVDAFPLSGAARTATGTSNAASQTTSATPTAPSALTPVGGAPRTQTVLDEELRGWLERATDMSPLGVSVVVESYASGIAGFGLATESETAFVPFSPGHADMLPLMHWLAGPSPKLMHGAKSQIKELAALGIPFAGLAFDTEIADWIIRPDSSKRELADLVGIYLGEALSTPDPNQLVPEEDELGAAGHAWLVERLSKAIRASLDARSLALLLEIEIPTLVALAAMELRGVTVSHEKLSALSTELGDRASAAAASAFAEIGREVNLASPKQLQEVLFDQLNMPKTRATKTGYTTDAAALVELQEKNPHPFLGFLLEHRDVTKLRQIVESLDTAIGSDHRIHTTYQQAGTSTGRLS